MKKKILKIKLEKEQKENNKIENENKEKNLEDIKIIKEIDNENKNKIKINNNLRNKVQTNEPIYNNEIITIKIESDSNCLYLYVSYFLFSIRFRKLL